MAQAREKERGDREMLGEEAADRTFHTSLLSPSPRDHGFPVTIEHGR